MLNLTPGLVSITFHKLSPEEVIGRVLRSARALGAPVIRVWAGTHSSAEADPSYRDWVVRETRRVASLAGECGIRVALEFHANTLTDTAASAAAFLEAAAHPNLRSLWHPATPGPPPSAWPASAASAPGWNTSTSSIGMMPTAAVPWRKTRPNGPPTSGRPPPSVPAPLP